MGERRLDAFSESWQDLTISSAYYRVERIKRSMNETAASFFFFLHHPYSSRPSLSLSPSYFPLLSCFAFTANIQTPGRGWRWLGGGNGAARVRRVGVLVSHPPFPWLVVSSPCLRPPTDHRCTLSVPDHSRPLSTTTVPSKLVPRGWIRGEPRDEGVRIYYERRSGEALFFMKNSPPPL